MEISKIFEQRRSIYSLNNKSNLSLDGKWYYGEVSEDSRRIYKSYATTSTKRRLMEKNAIAHLADDIYFRILPRVMRKITQNISGEIENEINDLIISQYGRWNIIRDRRSHPEERLPEQSIAISKSIFIVPESCRKGIPLWEFIKWHALQKEEDNARIAHAIEEWSGIPAHLQLAAYESLLNFLRKTIQEEHDKEDRYCSGEVKVRLYIG